MNRREKQLRWNLWNILGGYENGMSDYGEEMYPKMTEDEVVAYAKAQMYDIKCDGCGGEYYGKGICKDLKFLGNDRIKAIILDEAADCGILK